MKKRFEKIRKKANAKAKATNQWHKKYQNSLCENITENMRKLNTQRGGMRTKFKTRMTRHLRGKLQHTILRLKKIQKAIRSNPGFIPPQATQEEGVALGESSDAGVADGVPLRPEGEGREGTAAPGEGRQRPDPPRAPAHGPRGRYRESERKYFHVGHLMNLN